MKPEEVNAAVAKELPAIGARDKIAFFAVDVSRGPGEPVLTYTSCTPDSGMADPTRDEAWSLVRQKFRELAAAIGDAVAPLPDGPRVPDGDREIRFLGDLQRLKAEPGDVFVLSCEARLAVGDALRIQQEVACGLPVGTPVLVLDRGMKLGLIGGAMLDATAPQSPAQAQQSAVAETQGMVYGRTSAETPLTQRMTDARADGRAPLQAPTD